MVYNITMNDNNSNIIVFPKVHRADEETHALVELALDVFEDVAMFMDEEGYDVAEMQKDFSVIVNLFIAALYRQHGKEHFLHETLEGLDAALSNVLNEKELGTPANDSD